MYTGKNQMINNIKYITKIKYAYIYIYMYACCD